MVHPKFLLVGDILGAHGLKGALSIYSHTRPASAVAGYSCWWVGLSGEQARPYQVTRCWQHGKRVLAEIEGVSDCTCAEALKGQHIWVPASAVESDDDEYLWDDLIGCRVREQNGTTLGIVRTLEEYGAQDNLVVQTDADAAEQGEWMIPFTSAIIIDVDVDARLILVDLPAGMDACFTPKF